MGLSISRSTLLVLDPSERSTKLSLLLNQLFFSSSLASHRPSKLHYRHRTYWNCIIHLLRRTGFTMNPTDPRAPVNAHGMLSPALTAKSTRYSPSPAPPSPARFPQAASPVSGPNNHMDVFQQMMYTDSPAPMKMSPYPTPSSQSTMDTPAGFDPAMWAEALRHAHRAQQQQLFQQPPTNMPPPNAFPPRDTYYPQQHHQQHSQQHPQQDSGYGSGTYDNLGQAHGLPGQHSQANNVRPGHTYGKVVAKGNARVIRGNARDSTRPVMNERQHRYSDAEVDGDADMFDGDVTTEQMREFYLRRRPESTGAGYQ